MTVLDAKLPKKVFDVIKKYGADATFTVSTPGTYDPTTRETTPSSIGVPFTVKVSPPAPFDQRFIDGKTILAGDLYVILPAEGLTTIPNVTSTVSINGVLYRVTPPIDVYMSGELVAAYQLHLRRD